MCDVSNLTFKDPCSHMPTHVGKNSEKNILYIYSQQGNLLYF